MQLADLVQDIANALTAVDASGAAHKQFKPGIGPFGEADAVRAALGWLKSTKPDAHREAATKSLQDLLIPGEWAFELKVVRPFGDNGLPAEHGSENILHPGNTSSLGDCLELQGSQLTERKSVVLFGCEHTPEQVSVSAAHRGFEMLARDLLGLHLSRSKHVLRTGLIHPVHQQLRVFGYEAFAKPASVQDSIR